MTLDHIAAFSQTTSAKVYRDVCERFGVDPAAFLEAEDDVLAHQLRVALVVAHPPEAPEEPEAQPDPFEAARAAGAKVKAVT